VEDAGAEQVEPTSAEHLPLQCLVLLMAPSTRPVLWSRLARLGVGSRRRLRASPAVGGDLDLDLADTVVELVVAAAGHHRGDPADVVGQPV
jgi:hypothetical protein